MAPIYINSNFPDGLCSIICYPGQFQFKSEKLYLDTQLVNHTKQELAQTLNQLRGVLDRLLLQGLHTVGPDELQPLQEAESMLSEAGADYFSGCLKQLVAAAGTQQSNSAVALLEAQTALFIFERLLSQSAGIENWNQVAGVEEME